MPTIVQQEHFKRRPRSDTCTTNEPSVKGNKIKNIDLQQIRQHGTGEMLNIQIKTLWEQRWPLCHVVSGFKTQLFPYVKIIMFQCWTI